MLFDTNETRLLKGDNDFWLPNSSFILQADSVRKIVFACLYNMFVRQL